MGEEEQDTPPVGVPIDPGNDFGVRIGGNWNIAIGQPVHGVPAHLHSLLASPPGEVSMDPPVRKRLRVRTNIKKPLNVATWIIFSEKKHHDEVSIKHATCRVSAVNAMSKSQNGPSIDKTFVQFCVSQKMPHRCVRNLSIIAKNKQAWTYRKLMKECGLVTCAQA